MLWHEPLGIIHCRLEYDFTGWPRDGLCGFYDERGYIIRKGFPRSLLLPILLSFDSTLLSSKFETWKFGFKSVLYLCLSNCGTRDKNALCYSRRFQGKIHTGQ